jgi:hypothetical protein
MHVGMVVIFMVIIAVVLTAFFQVLRCDIFLPRRLHPVPEERMALQSMRSGLGARWSELTGRGTLFFLYPYSPKLYPYSHKLMIITILQRISQMLHRIRYNDAISHG